MKQSNAKVNVSGVDEGTTVNPFMRGGLARLSLPRAVRVEARERNVTAPAKEVQKWCRVAQISRGW